MKEAILEKTKIKNLKTKIYLMIINLDLNIIECNDEETYNPEEDFNEVFYYNLNKTENPNYEDNREYIDYENYGDFENLDNE